MTNIQSNYLDESMSIAISVENMWLQRSLKWMPFLASDLVDLNKRLKYSQLTMMHAFLVLFDLLNQ